MTGYIPEEKVSEIRNAADIVDIISETVLLKKTGKNFIGLCPFHTEKTPSFTVSPDKQIFHCFGCGSGGNVFSYLMRQEGLSFPEAARQLARRYSISLPQKGNRGEDQRRASEKERLYAANKQALEYFQHMLLEHPAGKSARQYLTTRGIQRKTAEAFQLGYVPDGWDHLIRHFRRHRRPLEPLERSGLIVKSKRGKGFYDRFRNRLMFPIIDPQMRVLGFGGRVLDDALPKYMNSPETPVYNKRRVLYGLHRTKDKCRTSGSVFIVEGYLDLIALYQNGVENTVATLGTALTSEHVRLLTRYAERMMLVYDSDEAGLRSAQRCIDIFWKDHVDFRRNDVFQEKNADTRIMVLPEDHDPDSFIREFGAEKFVAAARKAPGIISFLMERAVQAHGLSVEGKIRIVNAMLPSLAAVNDRIAKALYVKNLSERIELDERTIWSKLKERPTESAAVSSGQSPASPETGPDTDGRQVVDNRFERQIISMMLQFPDILIDIETQQVLDYFESNRLQSIGKRILSQRSATAAELLSRIENDQDRDLAASLAMADESWTLPGCRRLLAQFVSLHVNKGPLADIEARIKAAEESSDQDTLMKLLSEKQKIVVQQKKQKLKLFQDDKIEK